jgi:acetolactate synthase-1/2/3 large subunit
LGVYGQRSANLAVKYCDLLLVLGSRLDGRQTGGDFNRFADNARIVMVDIDDVELRDKPDSFLKIKKGVRDFLSGLQSLSLSLQKDGRWLSVVKTWQNRYPNCKEYSIDDGVNPHHFLSRLSSLSDPNAIFATDVGQNQIWTNSSLMIGRDSVLLQSCGLGSMGFSIPAAIGGYFARKAQTISICGDGGFQMNSQELQTISCYKIPVKIFVLNNGSLGLIRIYQEKALSGRMFGSVQGEGFDSPDYKSLAGAYGLSYAKIENNELDDILMNVLHSPEPYVVEVSISRNSTCFPEPTYQSTIDNQSPVLSDTEKETIRMEALEIHG